MSNITINSNLSSLTTQRRLGDTTAGLTRSFERLSSGLRINRASDDAAGLAIADNLKTDNRVFKKGIRNLNDGLSLLNVADGALTELSNIVVRIRELAEQSANGTLSNTQREAIDQEAQELSDEFTRIAQTTEVNGLKLFDGSLGELSLQAGYGERGAVTSTLGGAIGDGSFETATSYSMDSAGSTATTLGDLNGDGILDLVTAGQSFSGGYATIRLGNGNGSFGASTSYSTESSNSSTVTLGDLNGDRILDLITAGISAGDGYATVRLGNGDGSFASARSYTTESFASYAVSTEDLNQDGIPDLVTAGRTDSSEGAATIRLGNGDGSFGSATSYALQLLSSRALGLGDVNGDGILDLVTAGYLGGIGGAYSTIQLGNGDGSFGSVTSYTAESDLSLALSLSDVNDDGVLDLITAGRDSLNGYATIRLGNGDGSFGVATSYASESSSSWAVGIGDLNGDGTPDLITAGEAFFPFEGYATTRLGNGDGTFGIAVSYAMEDALSYGLALGDLDRDGVLDLITAGQTSFGGFATIRIGATEPGVSPLLPFSLTTKSDALQAMAPLDRKIGKRSTSYAKHSFHPKGVISCILEAGSVWTLGRTSQR